jgi:hypothetical protein
MKGVWDKESKDKSLTTKDKILFLKFLI